MGVEEGGVSLKNRGQPMPTVAASQIVGECRARALAHAARLPGLLYEGLEKDLAERAANVFTQPDGNRLIEGLRLIQNNKTRLGEVFHARFAHHFDQHTQPAAPPGRPASGDSPGFSLIDDSELEESLAVNTLIGKLRERFSDELFGLSERYGELLAGAPIDKNCLPMGPHAFCHAIRDAAEALDLDTGVKLQCYKLFERVLLSGLGDFYADLNKYLVEKGVLPQLKARVRAQPSAPYHAAAGAAAGRNPSTRGGGGRSSDATLEPSPDDGFIGEMVAPVDDQMFQAMQYLLGARRDPAADAVPVAGHPAGRIYLPATPMLIDTLSSLQHDSTLIERSGELLRGGLKQHVVGRFETMDNLGRPGVINQIDDETIDVISMIFDYILDDKTLPDFIKALIGRLQIPVLKVAIVDRGFFSDKQHPVRQLLNELAYAGVGWVEESEAAKDRLYEKMEATVRRVLADFDNDVKIFATLLEDFRGFLDEEKKNFALAREKIGIEARENGQIERAKIGIAEEIATRLANRLVPDDVREFLATTWRQWLTRVQLEEGEDSPARARALQVVDDLIWSVEPKTSSEQRRRLGVLLPILLEELREGQLGIGRSEDDVGEFAAALERHHFTSLKGNRPREQGGVAAAEEATAAAVSAPVQAPRQDAPEVAKLDEVDRMFQQISGDIDNLPEVDMQGWSGFDDLIDKKDPGRQGSFERMMAEMGFEAESDAGPRVEDRYTVLVRALELGTWVELTESDGRKLRVKLAWVGDAYTNYSFVNRQYKVVAERPMYVLAEEFRNGAARVIEDVALFDRALDGVISGIMKFTRPRAAAGQA